MGNHMEIHAQHVFIDECGKKVLTMRKGPLQHRLKMAPGFPEKNKWELLDSDTSSRLKELTLCLQRFFLLVKAQNDAKCTLHMFLNKQCVMERFFLSFSLLSCSDHLLWTVVTKSGEASLCSFLKCTF